MIRRHTGLVRASSHMPHYSKGTSMATPHVAGAEALVSPLFTEPRRLWMPSLYQISSLRREPAIRIVHG